MCSVNSEAVLKALFKVKDEKLTFAKALQIAQETEEAAKVAKETVYGAKQIQQSPSPYSSPVNQVQSSQQQFFVTSPYQTSSWWHSQEKFHQGNLSKVRQDGS